MGLFDRDRRHARRSRHQRKGALSAQRWSELVAGVPLLRGLSDEERQRLHDLCVTFVRDKTFEGCGGLVVDDSMRWTIAAQACLLVLELGLDAYAGFSSILVYPREFRARFSFEDELGIVTEEDSPTLGEAWQGGPVVLSWEDIAADGQQQDGFNLVVHEFSHKLDMLTGDEDGAPPLHAGMDPRAWRDAFVHASESLAREHDAGAETSVDPYAAENPAECFAVFSETFFASPLVVQQDYPEVYEQLRQFYRQDPAARQLR